MNASYLLLYKSEMFVCLFKNYRKKDDDSYSHVLYIVGKLKITRVKLARLEIYV